ncbi:LamG-like jellyroll fold domain-containing protein [Coraliomargarita parva]|uniref:LamG-like jellyroll fold domain-containing protein n=1 Tax=Coraliomargarita parva TaxID=3014050 RepID=UPI0022B2C56B|nr:LamG-like jellyroll fold domain-containing protein [Coraliomargarita parva]
MKKLIVSSALFAALSFAFNLSAQTLLSQYTLDGIATDSGSVGADGALFGAASYINNAPGIYSQSLDVTGAANSYLEANVGNAYEGLTQMTVTVWVNLQGTPSSNDRLVSNLTTSDGGSTYDGFDLRISNSNNPSSFQANFNVDAATGPAASTSSYNANNTWSFIAVVYDGTLGSNQVSFYSGSESANVGYLNSSTEGGGGLDLSSILRIGSTAASGSDRTPPAYFSDVRVYDGLLDLGQLESVRSSAIPEPASVALVFGSCVFLYGLFRRRRF